MRPSSLLLVAALALPAAPAAAQSVTVGTATADNCIPFGCPFATQRYQQVYAASAVGGPALITSVGFTLVAPSNPAINAATYTIRLGYTGAPVNGLSASLDANVSGALTTFATLTFPVGPAPSPLTFTGVVPFAFDPTLGNLLLDVLADGQQGGVAQFASDSRGTVTSRAYTAGEYSTADAVGLVTTFGVQRATTTVPEPATIVLLGGGLLALGGVGRRRVRRAW